MMRDTSAAVSCGKHRVALHDAEFIATQAGDAVRGAETATQAVARLTQELIAGRVAQRIVDRLEVVEV